MRIAGRRSVFNVNRMNRNIIILLAAGFLGLGVFIGCNHQPESQAENDAPEMQCPELISLFEQMDELESRLMNEGESWENCTPMISEVTSRIIANQGNANSDCRFLNQKRFPSKIRFGFVDLMSAKLIRESNLEAIRSLFQLRMAFSKDTEVSEFLSEELGSIAANNPDCYMQLINDPGTDPQKVIESTWWNPGKIEPLISTYDTLTGGETVVSYLQER